jgi:hypothetical protein
MATKEELEKRRNDMELEDLEDRVLERRQKKALGKMTHDAQEAALDAARRQNVAAQKGCTHRKGGVDLKGVRQGGNDANYAVIRIRMPDGKIWQHCQRCPATWKPGDTARTHPTGVGYREALSWPSDNTMAEAAQFRFERTDKRGPREVEEAVEA